MGSTLSATYKAGVGLHASGKTAQHMVFVGEVTVRQQRGVFVASTPGTR